MSEGASEQRRGGSRRSKGKWGCAGRHSKEADMKKSKGAKGPSIGANPRGGGNTYQEDDDKKVCVHEKGRGSGGCGEKDAPVDEIMPERRGQRGELGPPPDEIKKKAKNA